MSANKFFVQITDKGKGERVQEVDPRMFEFIRLLPVMDSSVNEPNLLQLERYPDAGVFTPTDKVTSYYAGVVKIGKHDLVQSYHYFLAINTTKLKPNKKKAFLVTDFAITQQARTNPQG